MCETITIGRCIGCDRPARLNDRVCLDCLEHRGRTWAALTHRCRVDPDFRHFIYTRIKTPHGREVFRNLVGGVDEDYATTPITMRRT